MEKEKISKIIDSVNNAVHNDEQIKKVVDSVDKVTQNLKDQTVPKWRRILSVVLTVGAVVYDVCPLIWSPHFLWTTCLQREQQHSISFSRTLKTNRH